MSTQEVLVGAVACDWLTLTTFDEQAAAELRMLTYESAVSADIHDRARMQYKGQGGTGWFFGWGEQKGQPHLLAQYSGLLADRMRQALQLSMWRPQIACTRIDLQLTLPRLREDRRLSDIGRDIRKVLDRGTGTRGVRPKVKIFDSEADCDETVYVGSRAGRKFVRIYDKEAEDERYIRVEMELKKEAATQCWNEIMLDGAQMRPWLLAALPEAVWVECGLARWHELLLTGAGEHKTIVASKSDDDATMTWLEETIGVTIGRLAATQQRDRLKAWLDKLSRAV